MKEQNYSNLDSQYNEFLERHAPNIGDAPALKPPVVPYQIPNTSPDRIDPPLSPPPYSTLGNNLLKGFLQSFNYSPHNQGFRLDGLNGTVEFNQLFASEIGIAAPDGSVPFVVGGLLDGDVNVLFIDPTGRLFGVNTSIPKYTLHVGGTASFQRPLIVANNGDVLDPVDSNAIFYTETNTAVTITLPNASVNPGVVFTFYFGGTIGSGGLFTLSAPSNAIRVTNVDTPVGGFVTTSTVGNVITLTAIGSRWVATDVNGDWAFARRIPGVRETVTATEVVNVTVAKTGSVSDTATITESVTILLTDRPSIFDSTTVTESVTIAVI